MLDCCLEESTVYKESPRTVFVQDPMKSGDEKSSGKRLSVTIGDVPDEIPKPTEVKPTSPDEIAILSRQSSTTFRLSREVQSPEEGLQVSPKSQSVYSETSSRSNLERLKVPWEVRSGHSVADFDNIAPTNDYTMDEELGVGGFGTVFKGNSKTTGKEVAIKIIKRERLHSEDNFQEELKVARKLRHPNIVMLHASYQDVIFFGTVIT